MTVIKGEATEEGPKDGISAFQTPDFPRQEIRTNEKWRHHPTTTLPSMKINLTICGVDELPVQKRKRWTHVISIWEKALLHNTACRDLVKTVAPRAQLLFSFFEDTSDPNYPDAPRLRDVRRILEFTRELPARARVLVHCRAGISRSTAVAYAVLCQHTPPGAESKNLRRVESLRPLVMPNRLIVKWADKILKRNGEMLLPLMHGVGKDSLAWFSL